MKRIRSSLAAAALAIAAGIALLPALAPAAQATTQVTCAGTTLAGAIGGGEVRIPTTTDGSHVFNCELGVGNAGEAVARLQIGLDDCNLHAGLTVDGIYGPLTETAVYNVQVHYNLSHDGVYGPFTGSAMYWPVSGNPSVCRRFAP